jgi:glycosyltransferase involved in cell wall biosynthesis
MITVVKPLLKLHAAGRVRARIVLESRARSGDLDYADAVVFCRNTEPRYAPLLAAARNRGMPLVYDLDDNLLDLPPNYQGSSPARNAARRAMLEEYLASAAVVRVYSPSLAERVAVFNPRVELSFAPVDLSLMPAPREYRPPGPIRIAYATPRSQDDLCEIFLPALARILRRYANRVEAHFWGYRPPHAAALPNVRHHGLICGYDRYLRRFSRGGYDIGLAPLPDEPFYRAKTNNKFREYGACGIAGIYSRNQVYADCVEHESSGLLVANDATSWFDAIARLIEDDALRTRIQQAARHYVQEHYAQEKFEQVFLAQLRAVLSTSISSLPRAKPGTAGSRNASPAGSLPPVAAPGIVRRLSDAVREPLLALQRVGFRQAWTALRWFLSDRCLAARLRWQLGRPTVRFPNKRHRA